MKKGIALWMAMLIVLVPFVSAVNIQTATVGDITHESATINVETDVDTDVTINFFDKDDPILESQQSLVTGLSHSVTLVELDADRVYDFEVVATDGTDTVTSSNNEFVKVYTLIKVVFE